MPVKKSSAATLRRLRRDDNFDRASERDQRQRNFGARIGVRGGAADSATAARLRMADPGQGGGQQRLFFRKLRPVEQLGLPHGRADADRVAIGRRSVRSSGRCMMSTRTLGRASRIDSIGISV